MVFGGRPLPSWVMPIGLNDLISAVERWVAPWQADIAGLRSNPTTFGARRLVTSAA